MIVGLRKPDPVLDPWMAERGLLVEPPPRPCARCQGRGGFWLGIAGDDGIATSLRWCWCDCAASRRFAGGGG
jgi:hypothetical protein